ncbi:MAG TPA: hypothetical protein VII99_08970 [Bacteroidia bacterium]
MNKAISSFSIFLISASVILSSCTNDKNAQKKSEEVTIERVFRNWRENAVIQGDFCPKDSCTSSYFSKHKKNTKLGEGLGLPDTNKFHFMFADLNDDKQLDALVTFHPVCCTCNDTTGKVVPQAQVIILSSKNGYTSDNTFFDHLFADSLSINIDIDSVSANKFYGTYFKIGKQDTSVEQYQKSISIAFDTKKIKFISRKKK